MSESETEQSEPSITMEQKSGQAIDSTSKSLEATESVSLNGNPKQEPPPASDELSAKMERFSSLYSEMVQLLPELSQEAQKAMDQLQEIRSEVDRKRMELKALHDIDASAAELDRLIEDHRLQKENLERLMENQRSAYEEEKARHAQEEAEYQETLKIRRQQEEEEYRQMRAAEVQTAQQKLEEELQAARQETREKQELMEKSFREREQSLQEKELEWRRLIQELEQFMSKLTVRAQPQTGTAGEMRKKELFPEDVSDPAPHSEYALMQERNPAQDNLSYPIFGGGSTEAPEPIVSSWKEILLAQDRKIENIPEELSEKRESEPLKSEPPESSDTNPEI